MKISENKKLLIYKIIILLFAFVVMFLPATASRNLEVNSRVIVEMLGIDGGDEISVTAQYVMPTETDGATSKDKVTVKAPSITQAVEALSTALGRRAELGHCSMLILGDAVQPDVLKSLMTGTDVTADVYVSAAEKSAEKLVGDITDFMKKSGATDADFIAYSAKRSHIATTTLLGFLSDAASVSHTAYLPIVEMIEDSGSGEGGSGGGGGQGESGGSGGGEQQSGEDGSGGSSGGAAMGMKTEKLAVYNESGRVGMLEKNEARGIAWVDAHVEKSIVVANIEYGGKTYENVTGVLDGKRADIDYDKASDSVTVSVDVRIDPKCNKFNFINSISDGEAREKIKAGFAATVESEIRAGYDKALQLGADPMFIVRHIYRYEPDRGDRLKIGDIPVSFEVNVSIK